MDTSNGGNLLLSMGLNAVEVMMAVPSLFSTPALSDPDNTATNTIKKGAKAGLIKAGYDVGTEGKFATAMVAVVGPNWMTTKWYAILEKIREAINKRYATVKLPTEPAQTAGAFYKDPMFIVGAGILAYVLWSNK